MIEKRKFRRLQLSTKTILSHNGTTYRGKLENISMNGALISLEHGTSLLLDSKYDLAVYIEAQDAPLQFKADVVCVNFAMAGIKFISCEADSETRLAELLNKLTEDPEMAMAEHEMIRRRLANFLHEE